MKSMRGLLVAGFVVVNISQAVAADLYWWSPNSSNWMSQFVSGNPTVPTWSDPAGTLFLGPPTLLTNCYVSATGSPYTITLDNGSLAGSVFQTSADSTVFGSGITFNLGGTYNANAGILSLTNSTVYGILAFNGGTDQLTNLAIQGTIASLGGGGVRLDGSTNGIGTGFYANALGSQIYLRGTLTGLYAGSSGSGITSAQTNYLANCTMNGLIQIPSQGLYTAGTNTIGGEIRLSGGTFFNDNNSTFTATGNIHGYGTIGTYSGSWYGRFTEGSTLLADTPAQTLDFNQGVLYFNNATIQATNSAIFKLRGFAVGEASPFNVVASNGGTVQVQGTLHGGSGGFHVDAPVNGVQLLGGTLSGLYASSAGDGVRVQSSSYLSNATVNGRIVVENGSLLGVGTNIVNGEIQLAGGALASDNNGTITVNSLVHGHGGIGSYSGSWWTQFSNGGKLSADDSGQSIDANSWLFFDNGVLEAKSGGILNLYSTIYGLGAGFHVDSEQGGVQLRGGTLTGPYSGSTGDGIRVMANSYLSNCTMNGLIQIPSQGLYTAGTNTIGGEIRLSGGTFFNDNNSTFTATGNIHGYGTIGTYSGSWYGRFTEGGTLTADDSANPLTFSQGLLSLEGGTFAAVNGATLDLQGLVVFDSGAIVANGTVNSSHPLTVPAGGSVSGQGLLGVGQLTNGGIINPGNPYGFLTLNGNYVQQPGGTLRIDLDGLDPGHFDRLVVTGQANLGGELQIFPTGGYVPQFGDTFRILTANTRINKFATTPNTQWQTIYGSNYVDIRYLVSGAAFSYPYSMDVIEGSLFEGTVESLQQSSDDSVQIFNDDVTLRAGLEVRGPAPLATFSKLWFVIEASVNRPGLSQAIQLYDYSLNRFVELNGGVATPDDQLTLVAVLTNPMRFKGPGNEVKSRIIWNPINDEDPAQDGWLHNIDLARWEVSP